MKPDEQVDELQSYRSFANLPYLVLCKIFRHLCAADLARAACVCSQWYDASKDAALWKTVSVNSLDLTPHQLEKFLRRLPPHISYLRLRCVTCPRKQKEPMFTPSNIHKLKRNCYNLETLIIENALLATYKHETDFTVEYLPVNVRILSVRGSILRPDFFFTNIRACENLTVMDFTACLCISDRHMDWFSRLYNLEELYLAGCAITNNGIAKLYNLEPKRKFYEMEENAGNNLRRLKIKVLDLEGTNIDQGALNIIREVVPFVEKLFLGRTTLEKSGPFDIYSRNSILAALPRYAYPVLDTVCLQHAKFNRQHLDFFANVKSLKHIKLAACDATLDILEDVAIGLKQKLQFVSDSGCSSYCNHFMRRDPNYI